MRWLKLAQCGAYSRFGTIRHLSKLKNVKNTHEGVLLLLKLQAEASSMDIFHFSYFHLSKWYQIAQNVFVLITKKLL